MKNVYVCAYNFSQTKDTGKYNFFLFKNCLMPKAILHSNNKKLMTSQRSTHSIEYLSCRSIQKNYGFLNE